MSEASILPVWLYTQRNTVWTRSLARKGGARHHTINIVMTTSGPVSVMLPYSEFPARTANPKRWRRQGGEADEPLPPLVAQRWLQKIITCGTNSSTRRDKFTHLWDKLTHLKGQIHPPMKDSSYKALKEKFGQKKRIAKICTTTKKSKLTWKHKLAYSTLVWRDPNNEGCTGRKLARLTRLDRSRTLPGLLADLVRTAWPSSVTVCGTGWSRKAKPGTGSVSRRRGLTGASR